MELKIVVEGKPVPKGRPRFNMQGYAYTPRATELAELGMAEAIRAACAQHGWQVSQKPLSVGMDFFLGAPANPGQPYPAVKPDLDNLAKLVLDAMNGLVYDDDRRVISLVCRKGYGSPERTEIAVKEVL